MKTRILFVCLGNICRSPMAKAIFQREVKTQGLEDEFEVDAAGTSDYHIGEAPDRRALHTLQQQSIRLEHRAKQLSREDFYHYDYILVMDRDNLQNARQIMPQDARAKLHLFGDWKQGSSEEVPDPYFGGPEGFLQVYRQLHELSRLFIEEARKG